MARRISSKRAKASVTAVGQINASMHNVSAQTNEATAQAQDIKNIVSVIQDIAEQTNLLALMPLSKPLEQGSAAEALPWWLMK